MTTVLKICLEIVNEMSQEIETLQSNFQARIIFSFCNYLYTPSNIYGQSSVYSGKNTSFKNNCFWSVSTYPKLTDLISLLKFLTNVNVVYLYSLLVNPYRS